MDPAKESPGKRELNLRERGKRVEGPERRWLDQYHLLVRRLWALR